MAGVEVGWVVGQLEGWLEMAVAVVVAEAEEQVLTPWDVWLGCLSTVDPAGCLLSTEDRESHVSTSLESPPAPSPSSHFDRH